MKKYISIAIMLELLGGKRYTAPALAEKYETSVKTVYRAVDTLIMAGMPIACYPGKNGGYELIKQSKISSSFFTLNELSEFITFLKTNPTHEEGLSDRLSSLFSEPSLKGLDSHCGQLIIDSDIWGDDKDKADFFEKIKSAIENQQPLEIVYKKEEEKQRVIEPYTLVYKAGVWYVYAFCTLKQSFRLFRISRIERLKTLSTTFTRKNIDLTKRPWNKEFADSFEKIKMELSCDQSALPEIYDWLGKSKVKILESGNLLASVSYSQGLVHRLMLLGEKVKIVAPEKLKNALKDECNKICSQYA